MFKTLERIERTILLSTLIFLSFSPAYYYISSSPIHFSYYSSILIAAFGLSAILYVILILCYRGHVNFVGNEKVNEKYKSLKTCHLCLAPKPERSHHCTKCNKCIKKMDHHCHWIGRCINYDNHGHFVRFLFFTSICASITLYYDINIIREIIDGKDMPKFYMFFLCCSTLISAGLCIITFKHLQMQFTFIAKNITFIEDYHCYSFDYSLDESPYNLGLSHNIKEVLGPFSHLLLGMPKGDGITFKKRYDVKYWPKHGAYEGKRYYEVA